MNHLSMARRLCLRARSAFIIATACMLALPGLAQAQQDVGQVAWSPDGKYLAFYASWYGDAEVFIYRLEEKDLTQLTANEVEDRTPAFTLDGKSVIYASNASGDFDVYGVDIDVTNRRRLFGRKGVDELWPQEIFGGKILYTSHPIENRQDMDIHQWDPDAGTAKILVNSPAWDRWPVLSPDGKEMLFTSNRSGKNEIYLAKPDGRVKRRLTSYALEEGFGSAKASYDPAGKGFVYWSDEGSDAPFSYRIQQRNIESGATVILPRHVRFTALPVLSPDGKQIAYVAASEEAGLDGPFEIFVMNADGSDNRRVFPWTFE